MSYVLDHHNVACDPYGRGDTSDIQMALASWLTHGLRFALPLGTIILFRRRLYSDVGSWRVCGMARPDASTIKNWPGFDHEAEMGFQYCVARALGNGFIAELTKPVRVDFDKTADRVTPALSMFPLTVVATPKAGGRFEITWTYDSFGQGALPTDFRVFEGATPATVVYATPLTDSVTSLSVFPFLGDGVRHILQLTQAYGDGTDHVFAVRARSSEGDYEQSVYTTDTVTANAGNPADATPVSIRMRRT